MTRTSKTKKKNKTKVIKGKIIALVVLFCFVLGLVSVFLLNYYVISKAKDYIITSSEATELDVDCIIVLGAKVFEDQRLSDILKDRVLVGLELYNLGVSDRILMSGDNSREEYNEVRAMKSFALSEGAKNSDVFMDKAGFSTYETMYRARDVFEAKKVVIVTQEFHLSRAVYIARSLGLEAYGVSSDLRRYQTETKNDIRESGARIKAVFSVVFGEKPRFLGDPIPISGSGLQTHDDQDNIIFEKGEQTG